jgi:glycosyltransferase involved in cell wall biosynthesis
LEYDASSDRFSPAAPLSLRLVFIARGGENYGTERELLGFLTALPKLGCEIAVYALGEGPFAAKAAALADVSLHLEPHVPNRFIARGSSRLLPYLKLLASSTILMRRLARFLATRRFDAVVFCEHGLAVPIGIVARLAGLKSFWLMPNIISANYPFDINRRIYAATFRHLAVTPVANSEFTRSTLGRGLRYSAKIDLGIDETDFRHPANASPHASPPGEPGPIRLLVMARLVPTKGQLVLLRAVLGGAEFAAIHLVICGGPLGTDYAETLQREAAAGGASARLQMPGPVDDVAAYYAAADVVVSARLDPEPFGLSIVEAMMMGKPVLAHALGGPADIVVDGVTGWHIRGPDVADFAAALRRMLQDRPNWATMGEAGKVRAQAKYTNQTMAVQFLDVVTHHLGAPEAAATCGTEVISGKG